MAATSSPCVNAVAYQPVKKALAGTTREKVLSDFGGSQFSGFKKALTEVAVSRLAPVSGEMRRLLADPASVDAILADGAARARVIATPIMDEVKEIVGFLH